MLEILIILIVFNIYRIVFICIPNFELDIDKLMYRNMDLEEKIKKLEENVKRLEKYDDKDLDLDIVSDED
jgi:hypothetical protein